MGLRARQGRKDAVASYVEHFQPDNRRALRQARPRWGSTEGRPKSGILKFIAGMLGLSSS